MLAFYSFIRLNNNAIISLSDITHFYEPITFYEHTTFSANNEPFHHFLYDVFIGGGGETCDVQSASKVEFIMQLSLFAALDFLLATFTCYMPLFSSNFLDYFRHLNRITIFRSK